MSTGEPFNFRSASNIKSRVYPARIWQQRKIRDVGEVVYTRNQAHCRMTVAMYVAIDTYTKSNKWRSRTVMLAIRVYAQALLLARD